MIWLALLFAIAWPSYVIWRRGPVQPRPTPESLATAAQTLTTPFLVASLGLIGLLALIANLRPIGQPWSPEIVESLRAVGSMLGVDYGVPSHKWAPDHYTVMKTVGGWAGGLLAGLCLVLVTARQPLVDADPRREVVRNIFRLVGAALFVVLFWELDPFTSTGRRTAGMAYLQPVLLSMSLAGIGQASMHVAAALRWSVLAKLAASVVAAALGLIALAYLWPSALAAVLFGMIFMGPVALFLGWAYWRGSVDSDDQPGGTPAAEPSGAGESPSAPTAPPPA